MPLCPCPRLTRTTTIGRMRSDTFTELDGSRYDTHVERINYSEDSEGGSMPAVRDEILWKRHLRRDLARVLFFAGGCCRVRMVVR